MTSLRSRVVVALLLPVLGFSLLVLPGRETLAACRPGTPCIENFRATPFETVSFPKMDWTLLGEVQGPASKGHDSGMLSGDATVTLNDLGAQTLGLTGSQVSGSVHAFPHNPPLIFARYAPGANELRIDIIKIERTPTGKVRVYQALFGPHYGEH